MDDANDSLALADAARAATDRHREWMGQLDAQLDELAGRPDSSVSVAACVAVAAQLALGHAVQLASLLHGRSLEAEATKLVEAVWDSVRIDVARESCARSIRIGWSAKLASMLEECELDEQLPQSASLVLATLLAAGLAHAQIEPDRWPLPEMARLVARQALQAAVADQRDEAMAQWFASFGPANSR